MDPYSTIRFKRQTARKFRKFSKANFKTHTETMAAMLEFFERNEISPRKDLSLTGRTLEAKLNQRTSAIIAIIRNIEKTQTKPTHAMLEVLFQAGQPTSQPPLVEKKYKNKTS